MSLLIRLSAGLRRNRNRRFLFALNRLHVQIGRDLTILDVGGLSNFWHTIHLPTFAQITLLNLQGAFHETKGEERGRLDERLKYQIGDARDLSVFRKGAFDVVVSNSVLEHVGGWEDIQKACAEMQRVGRNGWVQTPAISFPVEPHFVLPFIHWFAAPTRAAWLRRLPRRGYQNLPDIGAARHAVEAINLLSQTEMKFLFPEARLLHERFFGLTKSYIMVWGELNSLM
jgi:ubiquinone/menaquinone biosynthesis C-methylase UbiE